MYNGELVPISRKGDTILYGRVIGKGGKLGRFQINNDNGIVYQSFSEVERRFNSMTAPKAQNVQPAPEKDKKKKWK